EGRHVRGGERRAQQITLEPRAALRLEERPLRLGLDAFRHHIEAQAAAERQDRLHLRRLLLPRRQLGDQRAVDLEPAEAERADAADREVPGAEGVWRARAPAQARPTP